MPDTKFQCVSISPCPIPATIALDLGDNIWIVAVVNGGYLKMVKIKVTGKDSYEWIEAMYNDINYNPSCETAFTESCYVHMPTQKTWKQPDETNTYKLKLVARNRDNNDKISGKGKENLQ